jgi:hypothetical protein
LVLKSEAPLISRQQSSSPLRGHAVAWAATALLSSVVACSYYSEDLLIERSPADNGGGGGAGASPPDGSGGSGDMPGGGSGGKSGSDGGTSGSPSGGTSSPPPGGGSTGGTSTGGTNAGGEPPTSGGAPDTTDGGAGGEGPVDACPNDDDKLAPGKCGCGVPESCTALKDALAHRYSFNQTGSTIVDSVGTRNGTLVGATASMGKVVFNGTATSYLDLPNGTISGLRNASFEIWLVWGGGAPWQRIFDFGSNDKGEGNQGEGATYLYLTPSDGTTSNALRATFSLKGVTSETVARAAAPLPTGTTQHLVLVVDDTNNELRLYLNGTVAALTGLTQSLSSLKDVNNWVGRSNFADGPLKATIDEVRIYEAALTQAQVQASYGFGPNPSFL